MEKAGEGIYASSKKKSIAKSNKKISNNDLAALHAERRKRQQIQNQGTQSSLPVEKANKTSSNGLSSMFSGMFGGSSSSSSSSKRSSSRKGSSSSRQGPRMKTLADLPKPVRRSG
jgi:hypothetical protein